MHPKETQRNLLISYIQHTAKQISYKQVSSRCQSLFYIWRLNLTHSLKTHIHTDTHTHVQKITVCVEFVCAYDKIKRKKETRLEEGGIVTHNNNGT